MKGLSLLPCFRIGHDPRPRRDVFAIAAEAERQRRVAPIATGSMP
jgi:hypothetical protein